MCVSSLCTCVCVCVDICVNVDIGQVLPSTEREECVNHSCMLYCVAAVCCSSVLQQCVAAVCCSEL